MTIIIRQKIWTMWHQRLKSGEKMEEITKDMQYYDYYVEAYTAVLGEFLGNYWVQEHQKKMVAVKLNGCKNMV